MMKRFFIILLSLITGVILGNAFFTTASVVTPGFYQVESGDTYQSIATKLGLDVNALRCSNRLAGGVPSATSNPGLGRVIFLPAAGVFMNSSCVVITPTTTTTTIATTTTQAATTTTQAATTTTSATTTTMNMGSTTTTQPPAGALFVDSFDTSAGLNNLQFQIEPPGPYTDPGRILQFNGDHALNADGSCGGADTTRSLTEDHLLSTHVYFCAQHFMTAMNTGAYVTIAFTPRGATGPAVFPATANTLCWDRSEQNLGGRKWIEVSVIGANKFASNGGTMIYQNPIFNGNITANAVMLSGDDFQFRDLQNSVEYFVGQNGTYTNFFSTIPVTSDKMTRFQECIHDNGDGTVTRTLHGPNGAVDTQTGSGAFPAGPRVFLIADVTYDADKEAGIRVTDPYTWHWDNIIVSAS